MADWPDCPCRRTDCRFAQIGGRMTCLGWTPVRDRQGRLLNENPNTLSCEIWCGTCGAAWSGSRRGSRPTTWTMFREPRKAPVLAAKARDTEFPPWGKDVGQERRIFRCEAEDGLPAGYVISQFQVWMPGSYETGEAALRAFDFDDEVLQRLGDSVNPGNITLAMLEAEATRPSPAGDPDDGGPGR